ncbi:MAG: hypothetical protein Q8L48_18780 [Archangium sp.]|nr:hypothetical protein [Archangium sp.]
MAPHSIVRWFLLASLVSAPAWAFPWMVKHSYGSCATCHVDPSGAGQLTPYGRAQADVLVRWRTQPRKDEEEVPRSANFLWFIELPELINLSGNFRYASMIRPASSSPFVPLLMATDLYATLNLGPVVAHVTTGVGTYSTNAVAYSGPAAIAPLCDPSAGRCSVQWVAREFWLGAKFADEAVMVRAGRMNLPFGLRNNEHNSYVRALTRTDINVGQQVGVSAAYNSESLRGEVMGIIGNFQVGPDIYRERGYSAFGEYSLSHNAYLGLSSLITYAGADLATQQQTVRHAHGLFARIAPSEKLALLAEGDFLVWQSPQQLDRIGFAALAQADFDLMQGLHLIGTLEAGHTGAGEPGPSVGGWLSATWYFLPHVELRIDNIFRRRSTPGATIAAFEYSLLVHLHLFL